MGRYCGFDKLLDVLAEAGHGFFCKVLLDLLLPPRSNFATETLLNLKNKNEIEINWSDFDGSLFE